MLYNSILQNNSQKSIQVLNSSSKIITEQFREKPSDGNYHQSLIKTSLIPVKNLRGSGGWANNSVKQFIMKTIIMQECRAQYWFHKTLKCLSLKFFTNYKWNFLLLLLEKVLGVFIRPPGVGDPEVKLWGASLLFSHFFHLNREKKMLSSSYHKVPGTENNWFPSY